MWDWGEEGSDSMVNSGRVLDYERETYLFVNELSKSEISTFAKLRISSHDLHIEKGRHRKTILSERKCFLRGMAVEDDFVMECDSLSTHRNTFFDD